MATEANYVYQLTMEQDTPQGTLLNVLHARRFATTDPATSAQVLAFLNDFKEANRAIQHTSVTYVNYRAVQVAGPGVTYNPATCRQEGGVAFDVLPTGTLVGIQTGDALPAKDAYVVTFRTGVRGRSHRGRTFIGGGSEANQNGGAWSATIISGLQAEYDALVAKYGASGTDTGWRWVVFSRVIASGCIADPDTRHHPLIHVRDGDQGGASTEITSCLARDVVFSQRSRTLGKGV